MTHLIDQFDRKILAALQSDAHTRSEKLAGEIGLSASAVQRRIRVLRDSGVLEATVAVVDPERLGYGLKTVVFVELTWESAQDRQNLRNWFADQPEIQQAYFVTGGFDLVLIVLTQSVADFDALMTQMQESLSCIRKVTTNVTIETMKSGLGVPVL